MQRLHELLARRRGSTFVTVLALFVVLAAPAAAQTDVIRGRVTGMNGEPLVNVRVTATSIPGNVTREAKTNGQGRYQIAFPGGTGDYMMGFASFGYAFRQYEIKRLADEDVLIADVRLAPIVLDTIVAAVPLQQRPNRNQPVQDVSGTERPISSAELSAEAQGNIAAMAASLPGVLLVPGLAGEPDGYSVLGMGADQNSTTLNGMPVGANNLPRDAAISSSLVTSPYDVSRGGFSGGNFNIRSRSGSNFASRGLSLVGTTPQMQWTDRAAQALGNDYTNLSLGGMASGPIKTNKSFYNVSFQLGRQSRENQTLLNTSGVGLQTAGIAPDSVTRFLGILNGQRVPIGGGPERASRLSDNGSVFGSIDLSPPSSASGQSVGLNFTGSWRRQTPVGGGALQLASASGDNTNWNGGVQARHSGYFGMVLSETSAGVDLSRSYGEPYLALPGGRVRVVSALEDGGSGVQSLVFGGNQGLDSSNRTVSATFQNTLSWFDDANKHRIKLSTELQYSGNTQEDAYNLLGSYTFNSLADLEAGTPASFTRTLSARERTTGQVTGSLSLGDSYRRTNDFQLQYGVRMDVTGITTKPAFNPLVESTFERRNDELPTPVVFSPRVGFSWTVGQAQEIAAFTGAARVPRAVIRGGIGLFSSTSAAGQVGQVLANTGLPDGVQQLNCVGPAVPLPDWDLFARDPDAVPDRCADGSTGTVFSNASPNVTLFAPDFAPSRALRANLSWNGSLLDGRFSTGLDASYSLNLNQQRSLDLNFNPAQRFTLADDGRPVFVETGSIVPGTGSIASRDARVSQSFSRVSELRSDLESRTAQLTARIAPIPRTPTRFGWSLSYTYSHVKEQVSGFTSTAGNPLGIEWARSAQGPHQFSYTLRYNFFDAVNVSWNGSFRSGSAFTPMIAGDINGDGYSNDRAFVYSPDAAGDAALREGMQSLLAHASDNVRECLEKQRGRIAERNSCRGPWTSSANLSISLDRAKFRMPNRAAVSLSLSNPLGAADLLVNGSGDLRGWGQTPFADPSLLYVRGFDPDTRRYRYEVNQRFGATRPQFVTLRTPVTLTASVRFDLGATREQQQLGQQIAVGRTQPGSRMPDMMYRSMAVNAVSNPMTTILRSQDTLQLTALQADSIASMNRRYTYRVDSIWNPVSKYFAELPERYEAGEAYRRYLGARHAQVDMLTEMVAEVRRLLTAEQRRKLPGFVVSMLDPRYLALIRDGSRLYVGTGGFSGGFMGGEFMMTSFGMGTIESITVIRH